MLNAVERKIEQFVAELNDEDSSNLYKQIPHGKRLRAKLILLVSNSAKFAIETSAVAEMIHAASLLHDDVIDNAFVRRNKPSINAIYGDKSAIMLGDILYSKGFYELNNINIEVSKVISNAVIQLSLGEQNDVIMAKEFNSNKDDYIKMIYQKTASLIEASAEAGAILANKDKEVYKTYGKNIGIAFQMIDDILDITSSADTLGKPAMHDFKEGKTTLPYIYLYEKLDNSDKLKLISFHTKDLNNDELNWLLDKFQEHNIIEFCKNEAKELVVEASKLMFKEGDEALLKIAKDMIDRDF